jgi:hypothetical protein
VYRDKYRRYSPSHARPHHQPRGTIYHHPARAAVNKPLEPVRISWLLVTR